MMRAANDGRHGRRPAIERIRSSCGRPPAWDAGEAVPWPPPAERGAASGGKGPIEGRASEVGTAGGEASNPPRQPGERRKRKRRR